MDEPWQTRILGQIGILNVSFYEVREKRIEYMNEKKRLKRRSKEQTQPDYEAEFGMPAQVSEC